MTRTKPISVTLRIAAIALLLVATTATLASATEPCDDFGECKVLIEINSSDGDIGFHFLMDGDDLVRAGIYDPTWRKVFSDSTWGPLREQYLTETFAESSEPPCYWEPGADWDEDEVVDLEEFLDRWPSGTYTFFGRGDGPEVSAGETELTLQLPAAPADVDFDGSVISWAAGEDLGECASSEDLDALVADGDLPVHPENVVVDAWEIVLEPDVDDGDPTGALVFSIRVAGDIAVKEVTVPADYLASLPADTPVKVEVGAIGGEDNATFTEEDGFCVNEDAGCEDED